MENKITLLDVHRRATEAYQLLTALYPLTADVSSETAFALGETVGALMRAVALIADDLERQRKRERG